jgi:hypothetical protein
VTPGQKVTGNYFKEASLATIIVKNDDWDTARAKLKTTLDAQDAAFNASLKSTFAPKSAKGAAAQEQSKMVPPPKTEAFLSRSKRRG